MGNSKQQHQGGRNEIRCVLAVPLLSVISHLLTLISHVNPSMSIFQKRTISDPGVTVSGAEFL